MRHLALAWVFALGCGSSIPHGPTTPDEITDDELREDQSTDDEADARDIPVRAEDVPAKVRLAAASALAGADQISFVHTSSGQYEATAHIDGEEQDVTISPSGAIIDMDEVDDIDLTEDDDGATTTAAAPDDAPDDEEEVD